MIIHRAYTALDQFHWSENELATYEELKRIHMDNKAAAAQQIYEAEIYAKNAEARGEARGKAEGKIELAKCLLQNGVGIDVIARSSDLSAKQIEDLKKYILKEPSAVNF